MNSFSGRPRQTALEEGRTFAQVVAGSAKRARDEGQSLNVQDNDANLLSVELTKSPSAFRKQKKRAAKAATAAEAAGTPLILSRQEISSLETGQSKDKKERASKTEEGEEEARRRASVLLEAQPTSQRRGTSKRQPQQHQQQQQEQQILDTDQGEDRNHGEEALAAETRHLKQEALRQVRANRAENAGKQPRKATDGQASQPPGASASSQEIGGGAEESEGEGSARPPDDALGPSKPGGAPPEPPTKEGRKAKPAVKVNSIGSAGSAGEDPPPRKPAKKSKQADISGRQRVLVKEGNQLSLGRAMRGKKMEPVCDHCGAHAHLPNERCFYDAPGLGHQHRRQHDPNDHDGDPQQGHPPGNHGDHPRDTDETLLPGQRPPDKNEQLTAALREQLGLGGRVKVKGKKKEGNSDGGEHEHQPGISSSDSEGGSAREETHQQRQRAAPLNRSASSPADQGSHRPKTDDRNDGGVQSERRINQANVEDEEDDGAGRNSRGHGRRPTQDGERDGGSGSSRKRHESKDEDKGGSPPTTSQQGVLSPCLKGQQLSSIIKENTSGAGQTQATSPSWTPSDGGGAGYSTDESGSRQSKLARREKLRQRMMERLGCSYEDAKLTLAEVDAGRLCRETHVYRGDAWRLTQACDLYTTRAVALREEQREKWAHEVKLATSCNLPMATLAVSVAEREPALMRNGKLNAHLVVQWATRWVQERRANRKTEGSYYEESFVAQLQRDKIKKERTGAAAAASSACEVPAKGEGGSPAPLKREALRLNRKAVDVLFQMTRKEFEVLPPLNPEDQEVREMMAELLVAAQQQHGTEVEALTFTKALPALEASRYLPDGGSGWPSVDGALSCLEKCENRELAQREVGQIAAKAGADLNRAREARRAVKQQGASGDVVQAGVEWLQAKERGASGERSRLDQLGLTRDALNLLKHAEDEGRKLAMLDPAIPPGDELVWQLMEAAEVNNDGRFEPLSLNKAVCALDASRYLPGSNGRATVVGAWRCLEPCEHKELWLREIDRIAAKAGVDSMSAREARNWAAQQGEDDIVAAGVEWLKRNSRKEEEQRKRARNDSEESGAGPDQKGQGREEESGAGSKPKKGGCREEGNGMRKRRTESSDSEEEEPLFPERKGSKRLGQRNADDTMPALDLLGGVDGLRERAEAKRKAGDERGAAGGKGEGNERNGEDGSGGKKEGQPPLSSPPQREQADAVGDGGQDPAKKKQRTAAPLPRGVRRALAHEEERARTNPAGNPTRFERLDRRQQSKVVGKGTSAAERELARHTANSKVAEQARIGRQEDMHYALEQYRRQQQGERLTTVEQEWAALGATLSPAKVLGYGAGSAGEEEEGEDADELDSLLDAILSQYDCYEEDAMEALEATADEEGWNLDAAITWLMEQGVEAFPMGEDSEGGKYSDADGDEGTASGSEDGDREEGAPATPRNTGRRGERASPTANTDRAITKGGLAVLPKIPSENFRAASAPGSPPALQLRYRARSCGPSGRTRTSVGQDLTKNGNLNSESASRRISAAGGIHSLQGHELLVRQLQRVIGCDDATARLLLMDKRARDDSGAIPDVAKAVKLYYQGQKDGEAVKGDPKAVEQETSKIRSAAGTLHSMVLPSLILPDWDVGKAPEGGFTYPTFRRIYALFQKYQRQTNFATTVTLKSLVTADLRPTIEARCGLGKNAWKEVAEGGLDDAAFIQRVQETLKPVRATEFEVLFEGMKLKHPGNETDILATVEEWGEKWLSTEREAEEQGITLHAGRMKELFKKAVAPISRVSRLILGESFKSTAEWYTLIIRELRLRQSYAAEADRDGRKRGESFYGGSPRGGGGRGMGRGRFFGSGHNGQNSGTDSHGESGAGAQHNNHSGGTEPMTYQPPGRGRGRGDWPTRGRGGGQWAGRGGRGSGQETANGRGDSKGAGVNAGQWGNRQPINDPSNESTSALPKGKWWHDSSQTNLCCRSADCGSKQEIPFCQGCGQHHHGREWCYKKNDEGFNVAGYWSENRKGRAPLMSRDGRAWGAPPARSNHMEAGGSEQGADQGQGLA